MHFSFGLLMAYPLRELFLRVARTRACGLLVPMELVLAFSGPVAEVIEMAGGRP